MHKSTSDEAQKHNLGLVIPLGSVTKVEERGLGVLAPPMANVHSA
jgi:hypothetical protein